MSEVKRCIRLFTLFDYDIEEEWLREMHKNGWKFRKGGFFYTFDKCEPEDVIYKIDFQGDIEDRKNYLSMFEDYGWEYLMEFNRFVYFRKSADSVENNETDDLEIFSDNESKLDMMKRILRSRMLPILIIFLCCVTPRFIDAFNGETSVFGIRIMWVVVFLIYTSLFMKCYIGYNRNRKK